MEITKKLSELGLVLPPAPKPVAAYIPFVQAGDLVFVSGQLPMVDGKLTMAGIVPAQVGTEVAQKAAARCVLNALAIVGDAVGGDWSRVVKIVKLTVFVACDPTYTDQAKVANGASELLGQLLGEAGRHARAAVGVSSLPLGAPVELDMIVQIKPAG